MAKIKTKNIVKDIKLLDKAASGTAHAKNAFVKSKSAAEDTQQASHNNAEGYASDKVEGGAKSAMQEVAHRFSNPQKKAADNVNKAKEQFQKARQQMPKARKETAEKAKQTADHTKKTADSLKNSAERAQKTAENAQKAVSDAKRTLQQTRQVGRRTVQTAKQTVKTGRQAEKTIKTTAKIAKATGKGTIKTAKQSVKTAERTAKMTVKTAQQTAKAAQKSAQAAAKAAKVAARAAKAATKAAIAATKAAIRATIAMVKAIIAAIKGLVALIAAGGWVAVVVVIVICLVALLVGSIFGVFFSGEDSGTGLTMSQAISEINTEYTEKITDIKNSNSHDEVYMSTSRAAWKEVLAVYSVKTTNDPDNPQEVATMTEEKKQLLKNIFWEMQTIEHRLETKEVSVTTVTDDGEGNLVETTTTESRTILYITVTCKTADEMAAQYGFNDSQKAQLAELLSSEYEGMWSAVLYGIPNGSGENIVAVAATQIGNVGGEPYWSWYGFGGRVEWCACFVSWCANECGYIDAGVIPMFAACTSQGMPWFQDRGLWQEAGYSPNPGDIIFFNWDGDQTGSADHVGIVEFVQDGVIHTIEGNSSDSCARRTYAVDSTVVRGFGTPQYE